MTKNICILIFLLIFMQLNHVNAFDETAEERERKRFEETTIASQAWCEKGYNRDIGALANARADGNRRQEFDILPRLATYAFLLKKYDVAKQHVVELESLMPGYAADAKEKRADWYFGRNSYRNNAMTCNIILGRLALINGRLEEAKQYLRTAGSIWGQTIKNEWSKRRFYVHPWGLCMSLAKDLLERGEKDIVLEYLELCKDFWTEMDPNAETILRKWIGEIEDGKISVFGKNLFM